MLLTTIAGSLPKPGWLATLPREVARAKLSALGRGAALARAELSP